MWYNYELKLDLRSRR